MKNPFTYLKHLVKDPVNTIAEADERKKKLMPFLYGSLGVFALGLILQLAADWGFMAIFTFIGLASSVVFLFLLSVISSVKKKFEVLTCDDCHTLAEIKTLDDFHTYVTYQVEQDVATFEGYSGNKQATNGVFSVVKFSGSSKAVLSVQLTCPHCGRTKNLRYTAIPFQCHAEAKGVGALQFQAVSASLETAVRTAVQDYNDPSKRPLIPYSIHSSKNPHFEQRTTFKGANAPGARPDYMGAKIDKHQDVEEMLEHYFVLSALNGSLVDPSKSKK